MTETNHIPGTAPPLKRTAAAATLLHLVLIAIVAIAAFIRFRSLGTDSLWRDEAASWIQSRGSFAAILGATARDNYPPLHNLILGMTMHGLGDGEWALRLPSAIFGVLNVIALYWVGTLICGRIAGIFAALLLALSPFHIWYSQEARMYALLALAATLFAGTALWTYRRATAPRLAACALSAIALIYTHLYGAFTWIAIAAAIAVVVARAPTPNGLRLRAWLTLQAGVAACFLPWAVILARRAGVVHLAGFWIPVPTPAIVVEELTKLASGHALLVLFALAVVVAAPWPRRGSGSGNENGALYAADFLVVGTWLFAPVVIGIAISTLTTPIFYSRYVIGSLPAAALLAGIACQRLMRNRPSTVAVAAGVGALALMSLIYGAPPPREDWRSASRFIGGRLGARTCVLVDDALQAYAITYYQRHVPCLLTAPERPTNETATPAFDPRTVDADVVLAVVLGSDDRAARLLPAPPWQADPPGSFRGVAIVSLRRLDPG